LHNKTVAGFVEDRPVRGETGRTSTVVPIRRSSRPNHRLEIAQCNRLYYSREETMRIAFIVGAAIPLASCLTTTASTPAWQHFDACSNQATFHAMVVCGKDRRQDVCNANHKCSAAGDAIVAYAESLDQSVQQHEMSESEAHRKWIEFRMARANELAQAQQAAASRREVICDKVGDQILCD
jgi:hypothetical protein